MTLIAHGVLSLGKYVARQQVRKLEKKRKDSELSEQERQKIEDGLNKALERREFFNRKLKKLGKVEDRVDVFTGVGGAAALERTLGIVIIAPVAIPIAGFAAGIEKINNKIQQKKQATKAARQKAEAEAQEEAQKLAKEAKEAADEAAEKDEITLITKAVSDAEYVNFRKVDIPTDKSAVVAGLVDECGRVAEFVAPKGKVVLFLDVNQGSELVSAFFVDPETGNFEEIASVKSLRGIQRIKSAINERKAVKELKVQQRLETTLRNEKIMQAIKQKQ